MTRLTAYVCERRLFTLNYVDGVAQVEYVNPSVQGSISQWLTSGLDEWVDGEPRTTLADSPEFLDRLHQHLVNGFNGFWYERA